MRLQDLRQYGVLTAPPPPAKKSGNRLQDLLDGDVVGVPGGECFYREASFPLDTVHGMHPLLLVSRLSGHRMGMVSKDVELSYADLSQAVFLDTETTGLGMGTGTYVFLVGVGYLDGGDFVVTQYFLDGPGDERPFLDELSEFLARFPVVVTFNGKAFDLPLLESRYRLHRRAGPFN